MVIIWTSETVAFFDPKVIWQVKMCDSADFLNATSSTTGIVSFETWDFSTGLNIPSSRISPSVFVVALQLQILPVIWDGISVTLQLIVCFFTAYTFVVVGSIIAASGNCYHEVMTNELSVSLILIPVQYIKRTCMGHIRSHGISQNSIQVHDEIKIMVQQCAIS